MAVLGFSSVLPVLKKTVQEGMSFYIQIAPHRSFPKSIYSWHTVNSTFDLNARTIQPTKRIQIAENGKAKLFHILQLHRIHFQTAERVSESCNI